MKFLVSLVLVAVVAAPARAQPAPAPASGDAADHYERGRRFYDLKEYDAAIDEFKAAYLADPYSGYLFNLAQAYRLKGDCKSAEDFFKKFVKADPATDKKAKIDKLVAECVPAPAEATAVDTPATDPTGTTTPAAGGGGAGGGGGGEVRDTAPVVEHRDPGRTRRIAGLATAVGGVVLVGIGVGLAVKVAGIESDIEAECGDPDGCDWTMIRDRDASARRQQTIETVMFVSGGVAVVGGVALYLWGRSLGHEAPVAIAPTAGGAVVTAGWQF